MRKSSLGRRSSTQSFQPLRLIFNNSDSAKCDVKGKKKSMLLQPGFSQKNSVSASSAEKENELGGKRSSSQTDLRKSVKKTAPTSMRKSSSQSNLHTPMTPATPAYTLHANLPSGVSRADRSQMQSTDSGRMSSIGGTRILRKDVRPLSDKAYLNSAVAKIQYFFKSVPEAHMLFGDKVNLSPMTTALFVDLVAFLTNILGVRVLITKNNYQEELPNIMKKIGYRGKVERSWLITVNAPHSFQYVVGLLEWLVNVVQCMQCVDVESLIYPDDLNQSKDFEVDEPFNFKILMPHLKWYYSQYHHRGYDEGTFKKQDELLLKELSEQANLDDLEDLEKAHNDLENELNNPSLAEGETIGQIQELKELIDILRNDKEKNTDYIQKSKNYMENVEQQISLMDENEEKLRKTMERKNAELEKLHSQVESQEIQLIDKEQLDEERISLHRDMQQTQEFFKDIENLVFKEDLLVVSARKKVDSAIFQYSKMITEKRAYEPRLKDAELDGNVLSKDAEQRRQDIDKRIKNLKLEYKEEYETVKTDEERTIRSLNEVKEKLAVVLDDTKVIQSEKINLTQEHSQCKQNIQMEKKEIKSEFTKCQQSKNEVTMYLNKVDTDGLERELEKKKLILDDIKDDLVTVREHDANLLKKVTSAIEKNRSTIQKVEEKLLARIRSLTK